MSASDPVEDAVTANIKRAADDSGSFETHDLDTLVEADRYLASKASAGNPFLACKRARAIAAGPVQ